MAKGHKTGGRKRGTPNKTTARIKDAVTKCFTMIGGDAAFAKWAKANQTDFYTKVMPRLIPVEVGGPDDGPLPLQIELTDGSTPPSRTESGLS